MKKLTSKYFLVYIKNFLLFLFISGCTAVGAPEFSPDGKNLILSIRDGRKAGVYRIKLDDMSFQRLTFTPAGTQDRRPSYSPDGSKIVFSRFYESEKDWTSHLFLMDADGTHLVQLTKGNYDDFGPKFSPDEQKIYFLRRDSSREALYSMSEAIYYITIDGSLIQRVTEAEYNALKTMSISGDGKYLLVSGNKVRDKDKEYWSPIRILDTNNSKQEILVKPNIKEYHPENTITVHSVMNNPTFLPDGNAIIFSAFLKLQDRSGKWINDSPYSIYVSDRNTEEVRKIIDTRSHYVEGPNVSSDGKRIAFCTGYPYACNKIWLANVDGSDLKNIDIKLK